MASERDLELLDDYLTNRLKGNDKSDFELRLRQDPDLQSELNFHQQIADGLRKARAAELKNMLGKIPVSPGFDYSNLVKWTSAGAIATGIGFGLYLYLKTPAENPVGQQQITKEVPKEQPVPAPAPAVESATGDAAADENPPAVKSVPENRSPKKATAVTPATDPKKVDVFDPTAEVESGETNSAPEVTPSSAEEATTSSRTVVVDNDNRKYKFHYQLDGDNLTLFGDFEQNLYTIMEFKSEDKQTVIFMYYKNNYYLLNQNPGDVNRLVPVNDPALLQRLRQQRETN